MYIYPDNLKSRATLWLWQLKDLGITGVCAVASVLGILGDLFASLLLAAFASPFTAVLTAVYAFLTIRFEDASILDFIRYACEFFFIRQQSFEWRRCSE